MMASSSPRSAFRRTARADGRADAAKFSRPRSASICRRAPKEYSHRVLEGIGHNVPQEAPGGAFTDAILEVEGGLP
jgi:pimeloyl-ACP methyl ester carboxylesterase